MDATAIQVDLKKAITLVAIKHGIDFDSELTGTTKDALRFTVTMGDKIDPDMREYLAIVTPKMKAGHQYFKRKKPGLCDEMLGKRFNVLGRQYVYLGCQTSRPSYPVSVLEVKHGGYRQLKCHADLLDHMIAQYQVTAGKQREKEVQSQLNRVDPELAEEANFS